VEQKRPHKNNGSRKDPKERKRPRSGDGDRSGRGDAKKKFQPWKTIGICFFH
jgi:hypothetical protein